MRRTPRPTTPRLLALLVAVGLFTAACGGSGGGGGGGDGPVTVRLAESIPALSFAPLLVAEQKDFFAEEGVNVEFSQLESGATALQALLGGSVDMVDSASTEVAAAAAQNAPVIAVQGTIKMTLQVCARTQWMEERDITPESPLEDRLAAFKGATLGITGPGAVSDRGFRWLLQEYGGLDANNDVTMTSVGGASALSGALQQGNIQGFLVSPPQCQQAVKDGYGMMLVTPGDVPEFANYVHEVLYTTKSFAEEHPDAVRAVAAAISKGNNLVLDSPDEAISLMQESFAEMDADVIEESMREVIIPQVPRDGLMTTEMWEATSGVLEGSGTITEALDAKEGTLWTNDYLEGGE